MGSQIKCNKCKKDFGKILCFSCGRINICKETFFKSGQIQCGFPNCLKESYMINCIYCRKLNIFKKQIPINGQKKNADIAIILLMKYFALFAD